MTHIFRASVTPKIYREIEIGDARALYDLAEAVMAAFGFDFDHAFGFYSKLAGHFYSSPVKYELFADMEDGDSDAGSVKRTRVGEAFAAIGARMLLLFDYGDEWLFKVELIGRDDKPARGRRPRVVKSVGEAPPQYPDPDE